LASRSAAKHDDGPAGPGADGGAGGCGYWGVTADTAAEGLLLLSVSPNSSCMANGDRCGIVLSLAATLIARCTSAPAAAVVVVVVVAMRAYIRELMTL